MYDSHMLNQAVNQKTKINRNTIRRTYLEIGYKGVKGVIGAKITILEIKITETAKEK